MKKLIITILLVVASFTFVSPINTKALENNNIVSKIDSNVLTNTINIAASNCVESDAILGDPECEDSVAWLVQLILNVIKILGPILVILLSSIDFIMVIVKSDNEAFQKAQKKLITRLILALLLFIVPVIVEVILSVFGITGNATAGLH